MKYIKSYEKLIKNTDPRVLNHPLLEFSELLKEILTFGFKGFANMSDNELSKQIDNLIEKLEDKPCKTV